MSAPSKLTEAVIDSFAALLRTGVSFAEAADRVGVAEDTAHRWRRRGEAEQGTLRAAFARAVADARELGAVEGLSEDDCVKLVEREARKGSWRAAVWLLERAWPERWAPITNRPRPPDDLDADPFAELDRFSPSRARNGGQPGDDGAANG